MKRTLSMVGLTVALLFGGSVVTAPAAFAGERVCKGAMGKVLVDDLRVPKGATCTLKNTRIKGNIKVESGARLSAHDIRVVGNVQGEGHAHVGLLRAYVGGSFQVKQGKTSNVKSSTIKGDLQSFSNRGKQTYYSNKIDGNLQCKSNKPAPIGSGNKVGGNKEDQCRKL